MKTEPDYKIYKDGDNYYYVRSGLGNVGYAIFKCQKVTEYALYPHS